MASFTNEKQLQNSFFHSLSKTATEGTQLPFESPYKSGHSIYLQDVLGEEVPFAGDVTTADLMVTLNPSLIKKYDKVPLTPVAGSNNQAWCLYDSGKFVKPWIEPTDVMNSVGDLSHGYQIRLYKENGDFIPPTLGAYNFLGYSGLVIFNEGYTPVDLGWGNVKISVYVYIGTSLRDSLGGVLSGSTWLSPVKGIAIDNTLIDTPEEGDRYLIGVGAVNDWENHDNEIATYTSGTWVFQEPKKGDTVSNFDNYSVYNYNNITWVEVLINQWVTQDGFMKTKTPLGIDLQDNPLDNVSRIDFKTDYNVLDFKEGRLFWDDIYQTLRIINNDSETRRLGMDSWVQVYNNSGADIPKGSVVYIYNSDNETPVIKLALSDDYETSYLIGIVIENISNEEKGNVLYYGVIEGIDTGGFTEGDILYISDDMAGSFENVKPDGGSYIISLGIVLKSDSVNGEILFYSNPQSFPAETFLPTGWGDKKPILTFDDTTRTLYLTPEVDVYNYYMNGNKYVFLNDDISINNDEGIYLVYYDNDNLEYRHYPSLFDYEELKDKVLVCLLYWNEEDSKCEIILDKMYDLYWNSGLRFFTYSQNNLKYLYGITPSIDYIDEDGSVEEHSRFGFSSGAVLDTDKIFKTLEIEEDKGLPVFYYKGNEDAPYLRKETRAGYSFLNETNGRMLFNTIDNDNWILKEIQDDYYMFIHIYANTDYIEEDRVVSFIGLNEYEDLNSVEKGLYEEKEKLVSLNILPKEFKHLYSILYKSSDSFSNNVKCIISSLHSGAGYIPEEEIKEVEEEIEIVTVFKDNEFKILHFDDDTKSVTFNLEDIGTGENREIKIYDENIGLSNTIYSNVNPMPEKIGGLEIGATFDNIPIWQVLDTMLYPYQYPAFTSFSIGGQNTTLEVGASTTDNPEFLWATSNSSNIKTDSVELIDVSGGDVSIISNIGNTGSYVSSISGVSRNTAGSYVFRIKGLNSKSQNFQRDLTLNWRWRFYYGESNSDTLTEADVKNLRVGNLGAGYTGTYNFSPTGYKYLCYPVSWGSLSGWKDQSNNLPIPLASPYIVSITNINGVTEDYYCYRTYNILGGSITAVVS